ncbi:hypothetical protein IFR05_012263 [Cadophora sp. M221]|nr:hypothetical protein IFR05_012263 [Cadophora sp. M221]
MSSNQNKTAYVTGGASGIGKALVGMLVEKGARVCIADFNIEAAKEWASELNQKHGNDNVWAMEVDVSSWESQVAAFEEAVKVFGRIDYVFPVAGIGERRALPNRPNATGPFEKPDFAVMDVDGIGMIAIVGFVRTYGKIMAQENITLNAICPGIVETGISKHAPWYHAEAAKRGCLVEMDQMMAGFSMLMGAETMSGECVEVVAKHGARVVKFPTASLESEIGGEISYARNRPFHDPIE